VGEEQAVGEADAQEDGVGVGLLDVAVVVPGGEGGAELGGHVRVLGQEEVAQAFAQAVGGEPVAAEGDAGILFDLAHFAGEGVGDDVEAAVLVIGVDGAHGGNIVHGGGQGDERIMAEALAEDGLGLGRDLGHGNTSTGWVGRDQGWGKALNQARSSKGFLRGMAGASSATPTGRQQISS